jgi:hypothetical protein
MEGPFTLQQPPRDPNQLPIWFDRIFRMLSGAPGIAWGIISKATSKLSDLETRPHSQLESIEGVNVASTDTGQVKHVSDANGRKWEDHVDTNNANPHGTDHSQLDAIAQADDTSSNTDGGKHVTDAAMKYLKDRAHDAMTATADSTAADVATLKADFNTLLGKLRSTGRMAP